MIKVVVVKGQACGMFLPEPVKLPAFRKLATF
jgi:hypothetical protein